MTGRRTLLLSTPSASSKKKQKGKKKGGKCLRSQLSDEKWVRSSTGEEKSHGWDRRKKKKKRFSQKEKEGHHPSVGREMSGLLPSLLYRGERTLF